MKSIWSFRIRAAAGTFLALWFVLPVILSGSIVPAVFESPEATQQDPAQTLSSPPSDSPAPNVESAKDQTPSATKEAPAEPKSDAKAKGDAKGESTGAEEVTPNAKPQTGAKSGLPAGSSPTSVKRRRTTKRLVAPPPDGTPRKIVVREGGAREPAGQIVTGMTPEEANRQRQDSEKLLSATDYTLAQVDEHALNDKQQETLSQIHNYMQGSRSALKEGDIQRGHTLAMKANLLALDLSKR